MTALLAAAVLSGASTAAQSAEPYRAEQTSDRGVPVIHLYDAANDVEVSVVPSVGNTAYEMNVHGKNILWFPQDILEFSRQPQLSAVPLLAPWGNRLDEQAFFANGQKYNFDMELGNVRGANPIHGLLSNSPYWEVETVTADSRSARYTARLEFWRYPELMAQWPFAHEYTMTYELRDGELEVRLTIQNLSNQSMPVAVGFHPYYQIPGVPRDEWMAHIPARRHVETTPALIPTGEFTPMTLANEAGEFSLAGRTLDDGFIDLERDERGRAVFYVRSGEMKIETSFGPNYPVAIVWEPNDGQGNPRPFICIEPMTGITSAVNLAEEGKAAPPQQVVPGGRWTGRFWIRTEGI